MCVVFVFVYFCVIHMSDCAFIFCINQEVCMCSVLVRTRSEQVVALLSCERSYRPEVAIHNSSRTYSPASPFT